MLQLPVTAAISFIGIAFCSTMSGTTIDRPTPTPVMTCSPSCVASGMGYVKHA
jgi:hypothetical protein